MDRYPSLSSVQSLAPADFRRWVLGGVAITLFGYTLISAVGIWQFGFAGEIGIVPQMLAAATCGVALLVTLRGHEIAGGLLVLTATWCELNYGFAVSTVFPTSGMLVLPLLMIGFGLLLGARFALAITAFSIVSTIVLHSLSPALRGTAFTGSTIYWFTQQVIAMFAAWGLLALSLSGFRRVFRQLVREERDLADTIRFAPDGILVLDGDGCVLLANPAAEAVLELPANLIAGRPIAELLAHATHRPDVDELIRGDARESPIALELATRAGIPLHIEATARRMTGERRQLLLRDVSERMRADEERRAMESRLAHAQRLEAVGQLAGSLSHDFNNILTAVGGSAELLREETDPTEQSALLDEILDARDRGATLTRQLLAFARREVIQPRVIDVGDLVRALERLLQRVAGARDRVRLVLTPDCRVRADVGQLEHALVNLVSNARDAMPDGGVCTITVERIVDPKGVQWVQLHVTDQGTGMTEETAAHAFEPFFTTKARGQGTGLGLASVQGTALRSGGRALITDTADGGTRVTIELPSVAELPAVVTPTPNQSTPRPGPYTILIAEDDDAARHVVDRMLRRLGYSTVLARDGAEALRLVSATKGEVDLLLTDVMMPGLTGPKLADRVRELNPQLPVLFMSGFAEEAIGDLGSLSGDRDLIAKPFTSNELARCIAELLRKTA